MSQPIASIPPTVAAYLPAMVRNELATLPPEQQHAFVEVYERRAKSLGWMWVLWLIGWQFAYLRQWGLQFLYWFSFLILIGYVWWIVEAFKNGSRVRDYNADVAIEAMRNLKAISGVPAPALSSAGS